MCKHSSCGQYGLLGEHLSVNVIEIGFRKLNERKPKHPSGDGSGKSGHPESVNSDTHANSPSTKGNHGCGTETFPDPKDLRLKGYKWVENGYVRDPYAFDVFSDEPIFLTAEQVYFFECDSPEIHIKELETELSPNPRRVEFSTPFDESRNATEVTGNASNRLSMSNGNSQVLSHSPSNHPQNSYWIRCRKLNSMDQRS